jgi:hypothetical protein
VTDETPFYKKMIGGIGNLFSSSTAPAPVPVLQPTTSIGPGRNPALKPQAAAKPLTKLAAAN